MGSGLTMTNLVYGICTASAFYVFPRAQPEGIHNDYYNARVVQIYSPKLVMVQLACTA